MGQEALNDKPLQFSEVLRDELRALGKQAKPGANPVDALDEPLAALCLSGGGIRSASFALGALQALARFDVLRHFHYLSTVSGGGYTGSWLTAWRRVAKDDEAVFKGLNQELDQGKEAEQIAAIRADSNYLTPKLGLLSADTWTVVALYIRNLILNWLVFGPLFLGALFVPKICETALEWIASWSNPSPRYWALLVIAGLAVAFAQSVSVFGRLSATTKNWFNNWNYTLLVLLPYVLASICLTAAAAMTMHVEPSYYTYGYGALAGALTYAIAWLVGHKLAGAGERWFILLAWLISGGIVSCAIVLGLIELPRLVGLAIWPQPTVNPAYPDMSALVVLGLPWMVSALFAGELVYVGLASYSARGESDREWLARSAGWLAAFAASWAFIAALDLYGPQAVRGLWVWTSVLGVSGITTLVFGASGKTAATIAGEAKKRLSLTQLASIAGVAFAMALAMGLSWLDELLIDTVSLRPAATRLLCEVVAGALLSAIGILVSWAVNVNRFSLHAVYRNRLVRAFLGSARATSRNPDKFTGFDEHDELKVAHEDAPLPPRLFHVINATLNVASSSNLAWQERKAEPFAITPLSCGSPNESVGYRPTKCFGDPNQGISLGTAMAISGAAVSPNQGYHSSPLVGFLLMLFNVRLGWWLGNPSHASYPLSGPKWGCLPALEELAGQTKDDSRWIYLSDGGHFENLGIYEMVRRRCRYIVVSDAGCDPSCALEDLGNAVRKIFIDFGVSINFTAFDVAQRQDPPVPGVYCAVGQINYPGSDRPGWLLYVKPGYHGSEPVHVRSYAIAHKDFPHETTANQWFTESQLESYRALGAHVFELICSGGKPIPPMVKPPAIDLDVLRRKAEAYLASAKLTANPSASAS